MKQYMTLTHEETMIRTWRELSTFWKAWELHIPFPREGQTVSAPLGDSRVVGVTPIDQRDSNGRRMYQIDFYTIVSVHPENIGR